VCRTQFIGTTGRCDLAFGYQETAVSDRFDFFNVVANDDTRDVQRIVHTPHEPDDNPHGNRIQADERLVVDQDIGVHNHRTRQRDTTRHTARQLGRHQIGRPAQTYRMQFRQHDMANQPIAQFRVLTQWESDILENA